MYGNTFYKRVAPGGQESFVAVSKPPGVITVQALPPDFEPVPVGSVTYFKTASRYFVAYLASSGEELYVVVDPPAAAPSATAQMPPSTAAAAGEVYGRVGEAKEGTGLGGEPLLALELTDISIGGRIMAITTEQVQFTADGKNPAKKIIGGAALGAGLGAIIEGGDGAAWGAGIGAIAGTAVAAKSEGNQVAAGTGTAIEFRLARL